MLNNIKGDLIELFSQGRYDVIVHGCNCFCNMGAGIAKTIKKRYPQAYEADLATVKGDKNKLGKFTSVDAFIDGRHRYIINAYTQYDFRKGDGPNLDMDALQRSLGAIKFNYGNYGFKFGFPKIGAGLAGGDWNLISKTIEHIFKDECVEIVIYE